MEQAADLFAQFGEGAPAMRELFQHYVVPLQDRIDELQAQLAAQPPPVVPLPVKADNPKGSEPPMFSGVRSEARDWMQSVRRYIQLSPSKFPPNDEPRKILWALSYLRGGTAGTWSSNHTETILDPTRVNPFLTFDDFLKAFETAFSDHDRTVAAQRDMLKLKMGRNDTVESYTTAFEALAAHTGYNDAAHIEKYRNGLPYTIVEKIYSNPDGILPSDLEAWKRKARQLDYLWHTYRDVRQLTSPSTYVPSKPQARVTSTSTAPVASDAMDVDIDAHRRAIKCYNCGELGHISRNCPKPRKARSIRATQGMDELVAEVRAAILGDKKEEGIKDFPTSQQ